MSTGYRSYSNQNPRVAPRRGKSGSDHFFPFFFLVAGLVIIILLYQFISTWVDQHSTDITDKMNVKIESGSASILPWGEKNKVVLYDGGTVLEGDMVDLASASKVVLTLSDGTALRFGEGAAFSIDKKDPTNLEVTVNQGRLWVYPAEKTTLKTMTINGDKAYITTNGKSEVDFVSLAEDGVRVLDGAAKITAREKGGSDLASYNVGVGQEIVISVSDLEALKAGSSLSLLQGISDDYRDREWYRYNSKNDPRISLTQNLEPDSLISTPNPNDENNDPNAEENNTEETVNPSPEASLSPSPEASSSPEPTQTPKTQSSIPKPVITSPDSGTNVTDIQATIEGKVDKSVAKIRVDHVHNDVELSSLLLSKYKKGDEDWKYTAVGGRSSNLREGKNIYYVVALDENDNESEKASIVINYYPNGIPEGVKNEVIEKTPETSPEKVENSQQDNNSENNNASPTPTPQAAFKLSAPSVVSFNGSAENVTKENNVKVVGQVDPKSVRVFVNGFALTGYRGGEGQWVYYAAEKYGTLAEGNNVYRVYSVDEAGNKSQVTEFTINKES